jgi:hypothetical protein
MIRSVTIAIVWDWSALLSPAASAQSVDTVFAEVHGHHMAFYVAGAGATEIYIGQLL